MQRAVVVALVGALAGCGKKEDKAKCQADAEQLGEFLKATPQARPAFYVPDTVALVQRTDLAEGGLERGVGLVVEPDGTMLDGVNISASELKTTLSREFQRERDLVSRRAKGATPRLYLVIDQAAPWRMVVDTVSSAYEAGYRDLAFVFRIPATAAPPPPRSAVDDELDRIMASTEGKGEALNRATEVSRLMSKVVKPCTPLAKVFAAIDSGDDSDRAGVLIDGMVPALIECGCKADIAQVRSVFWRIIYALPDKQVISFTGEPSGELALAGDATWADASMQLRPGMAPVRLTAR